MPVISSRRTSYNYLTPSTTTSSTSSSIGIGTYRSSYLSSSSDTSKSSASSYLSSRRDRDLDTSTSTSSSSGYISRYGTSSLSSTSSSITGDSILSRYRSSALERDLDKTPTTVSSSYRSSRYYDFDSSTTDDKPKRSYETSSTSSSSYLNGSSSSTLSSRIGVSNGSTAANYHSTLPPLPNAHSKRSLSRLREQPSDMLNGDGSSKKVESDLDFYEKYSPSRYRTKFDVERTRSLSEASQSPSNSQTLASSNNPSTNTRSEVWRQIEKKLKIHSRIAKTTIAFSKPSESKTHDAMITKINNSLSLDFIISLMLCSTTRCCLINAFYTLHIICLFIHWNESLVKL